MAKKIIGYQLVDSNNLTPKGMASFIVYRYSTVRAMKETLGRSYNWKITPIHEGDVENPTIEQEDGSFIEVVDEKPIIKKDFEYEYNRAVELLRSILCVSGNETEHDEDIHEFLKDNDELPEGYKPYWEDDED